MKRKVSMQYTHFKYESPMSYGPKAIAKVKFSRHKQKRRQREGQVEGQTDTTKTIFDSGGGGRKKCSFKYHLSEMKVKIYLGNIESSPFMRNLTSFVLHEPHLSLVTFSRKHFNSLGASILDCRLHYDFVSFCKNKKNHNDRIDHF